MFHGSFVALVTPFRAGAVDLAALDELVQYHLAAGTQGIVPIGTTGESPTLDAEERAAILRVVVGRCRGRIPVVAGTGTNDTRKSIVYTRQAKELGADGALIVNPYYNRPTQEGLFRHVEAIAKAVDLPIVLYNIPGRTAVALAPETIARLAGVPGIVAIKEATGHVETVTQIRQVCSLAVLSGEDALNYPILAMGGQGIISVVANILPRECADLCDAMRRGDAAKGLMLHEKLYPVAKALFLETNPIPVKTALKFLGRGNGELRLPLCEMGAANADRLAAAMRTYGLLR
jgi:4-hydroxy-tetrahydrodipicolinate synthase